MLFVLELAYYPNIRPVPNSEGNYTAYFWGADSNSIFYITASGLMRLYITGGAPELIARNVDGATKGAVSKEGLIVLGSSHGLLRVNTASRTVEPLTHVAADEQAHAFPSFLPDGRILFLSTKRTPSGTLTHSLCVVAPTTKHVQPLFDIPSRAQYVNGNLIYASCHTLVARPFDLTSLRFTGPEQVLVWPVWTMSATGAATFSVSPGTILLTSGSYVPPLRHIDAKGHILTTIDDPPAIEDIGAAHTHNLIAIISESTESCNDELGVYDLNNQTRKRLLESQMDSPVFSADDHTIYFAAAGRSWANVYSIPTDGGNTTLVVPSPTLLHPRDASPDGNYLLLQEHENRTDHLAIANLHGPPNLRRFSTAEEGDGETAQFSHGNGHVLFSRSRGNRSRLSIVAHNENRPTNAQPLAENASNGRWSSNDREVYFVDKATVIGIDRITGTSRVVLRRPSNIALFDVTASGDFLVREGAIPPDMTVLTGWWPALAHRRFHLPPATSRQ